MVILADLFSALTSRIHGIHTFCISSPLVSGRKFFRERRYRRRQHRRYRTGIGHKIPERDARYDMLQSKLSCARVQGKCGKMGCGHPFAPPQSEITQSSGDGTWIYRHWFEVVVVFDMLLYQEAQSLEFASQVHVRGWCREKMGQRQAVRDIRKGRVYQCSLSLVLLVRSVSGK